MSDFGAALRSALGTDRVRSKVPLATLTTFRVGGAADWLAPTRR